MQLTKQIVPNQNELLRKRIDQIRSSMNYLSTQLETTTDEPTIKFKLRQCELLNWQRVALQKKLERLS